MISFWLSAIILILVYCTIDSANNELGWYLSSSELLQHAQTLHHLQVHVEYLVVQYMAYGMEFETEELQPADTASGWKNATKGKGTKREDAVWKYFRRIEGFRAQVSI